MSATSTAASQAMNTLNIVATQVQNLLNVHVTKYVNTGDRVVDNGVTLIVNSCIALAGAYLYSAIIKVADWFYARHVVRHKPETNNPTDIDIAGFDYSQWSSDTISKYAYIHRLPTSHIYSRQIIAENVDRWINKTFTSRHANKQTELIAINNKLTTTGITSTCTSILSGYFMPVWKYKNKNGTLDYVWLHDSALYSDDYGAMRECLKAVHEYCYPSNSVSANTSDAPPVVPTYDIYDIVNNGTTSKIGTMNPKKTFDGLFYDKKAELVHVLDKFMDGTMYPQNMCDNKLGILLYGPPGTGKTGTITALANYTKRDVYMVKNTTKAGLDALKYVIKTTGLKKMIIVFDEFDHILCSKKPDNLRLAYLKEIKLDKLREDLRDTPDDDKEERKRIQQEIKDLKEDKNVDKNDEIEMGDLLRFLDGVEDQTDRLIIATTNHPDKINPLLLRPGRFDLKLELGYCSMQMFCDIARNVFADDIARLAELVHTQTVVAVATAEVATTTNTTAKADDVIEVTETQTTTIPMEQHIAHLLEKKITPLNLINSCLKSKSFTELIDTLDTLEPDTFAYSAK
jgi:hypothetical protein